MIIFVIAPFSFKNGQMNAEKEFKQSLLHSSQESSWIGVSRAQLHFVNIVISEWFSLAPQNLESAVTWDSGTHKLRSLHFRGRNVVCDDYTQLPLAMNVCFSLLKLEKNLIVLPWCESVCGIFYNLTWFIHHWKKHKTKPRKQKSDTGHTCFPLIGVCKQALAAIGKGAFLFGICSWCHCPWPIWLCFPHWGGSNCSCTIFTIKNVSSALLV